MCENHAKNTMVVTELLTLIVPKGTKHTNESCDYFETYTPCNQRAKKVASNSPELVDFEDRIVDSVFHLPDGQVNFLEKFMRKFKLQKYCKR